MASELEADRITQKYLRRWPDSKRAKSWAGRMVHIQTENGVWRTNGHGYTWAGKPDAWVLPFEKAQKCVAHCGPEKQATFIAARPAPATTDTGLVRYDLSIFGNGIVEMGGGAYVRADQAEELLAAERARAAEKERLRFEGDLDKWMKIIGAGITGYQPEAYALMDFACEELVKLRADNAAQAARIKELEAERSEWSEEFAKRGRAEASEGRALAQIADLKAQLAVMREALGDLVSWFSDPSEYGPWIIKSGKHGADDAVEHARAVLGGKPS